jgi:hypothetical protein
MPPRSGCASKCRNPRIMTGCNIIRSLCCQGKRMLRWDPAARCWAWA